MLTNTNLKPVIDAFLAADIATKHPGYFALDYDKARRLADMPGVIEQVRLRVYHEVTGGYSIALNHLLNELHGICYSLDCDRKKDYDAHAVVEFLDSQGVPHENTIKVRKLFDRRNTNQVSHPETEHSSAWSVTKSEYQSYHEVVAECLSLVL